MHNRLFPMNLQLFSLWGPNGAPETSTNPLLQDQMIEEAAPAVDPFMIEPAPAPVPAAEPAPAHAPVAPAPAPALDPDELVQRIMQAMQDKQPMASEVNEPELTPEQIEERNTMARDAFLDDPTAFLEDFKAKVLSEAKAGFDQELAPYKQQVESQQRSQELQGIVEQFKARTPDYDDHVADMAAYLAEKPHLENSPDALDIAYEVVKGRRSTAQAAANQPGSEKFVSQAAADPAVQQQVTKEYLQKIKDNQPPIVVKGSGNLGMPTSPEKPRSIKEATALLGRSMASKGF